MSSLIDPSNNNVSVTASQASSHKSFFERSKPFLRKLMVTISSLILISSWILATVFYIKAGRCLSNFHFFKYNNLPIKFEVSLYVLYPFGLYFSFIKLLFIFAVFLLKNEFFVKILNNRIVLCFCLDDILSCAFLILPIIFPKDEYIDTIIPICTGLASCSLACQSMSYCVFKGKRTLHWSIQFFFFIYTTMRMVFSFFQIINGMCFYIFNLYFYSEQIVGIFTLMSNCIVCYTGILLMVYYTDIFFLTFFIHLNLGFVLSNYTQGLGTKEYGTNIGLCCISFLCIIYMISKYKLKVFGEQDIKEAYVDLNNQMLINYNEN